MDGNQVVTGTRHDDRFQLDEGLHLFFHDQGGIFLETTDEPVLLEGRALLPTAVKPAPAVSTELVCSLRMTFNRPVRCQSCGLADR